MSWTDDDPTDTDFAEARELGELGEDDRCDWCGSRRCTCDDALFDADELGLDPEDDDGR